MHIPHDRSAFFSSDRYKKSLELFFETELNNDGVDITSEFCVSEKKEGKANIVAKQHGMLAGQAEIEKYFIEKYPDIEIIFEKKDGEFFAIGDIIISFIGNAQKILKIERVILNTLSRMSGIATTTQKLQKKSKTKLAATRKTQWSFLDKKSVFVGGGLTHRMGLFDAVLIKENHIISAESFECIVDFSNIEKCSKIPYFIEIEVEKIHEFEKVFEAFWQRENITLPVVIMLDNFSPEKILEVLSTIPYKEDRHNKNIFIEISGGITEKNLPDYSDLGADVISMGALTHSVMPIDFSLRFEK